VLWHLVKVKTNIEHFFSRHESFTNLRNAPADVRCSSRDSTTQWVIVQKHDVVSRVPLEEEERSNTPTGSKEAGGRQEGGSKEADVNAETRVSHKS